MRKKESLNWLPKLSYFKNKFFLAAFELVTLENFSKGNAHSPHVPFFPLNWPDFISLYVEESHTRFTKLESRDPREGLLRFGTREGG